MSDDQVRDAVQKLELRMADMEADVRVVKHDVKNMQQSNQGLATKLDRLENRVGEKIDAVKDGMANRFETLTEKVAAINVQQARGAGFFAGIAAVITVCSGLVLGIAKLLFGGSS